MFYFYKTTNLINNKYYYGLGQRDDYYGSGTTLQKALIKKYSNYYELGAVVSTYYHLREKGLDKDECEQKTLKTTFKK